jgi:hypothetical protein
MLLDAQRDASIAMDSSCGSSCWHLRMQALKIAVDVATVLGPGVPSAGLRPLWPRFSSCLFAADQ